MQSADIIGVEDVSDLFVAYPNLTEPGAGRLVFLPEMHSATGFMAAGASRQCGLELQAEYKAAAPFPHTVIDQFLPPEILEMCLQAFPGEAASTDSAFDRAQERLKTQFNPDALSDRARTLFYAFNAQPFIRVLENITGIRGLIPDPYFLGAGFHEVANGGHLSIHADFNHHKPMNLERRINVLIYLNKAWSADYGGQLELWDTAMKGCVRRVIPEFNRCVIFNTTSNSYHGNPDPVRHPGQVPRRSIALYYYTSTWSPQTREHTTQFKVRKGTQDRADWRVRRNELVADFLPPILGRGLRRLMGGSDA